jgi:hypothetical protein
VLRNRPTKRRSKLKKFTTSQRKTSKQYNSSLSKSVLVSKLMSKKMPKNRIRLSLRNALRTSQSLMSRRPMKKWRKLLRQSSHPWFSSL